MLLILKEFDIVGIIDEPVARKRPRNEYTQLTRRPSWLAAFAAHAG